MSALKHSIHTDYSLQQLHKKRELPLNFDILIPFLKFEKELSKELLFFSVKTHLQNSKIFIVENMNESPIWAQCLLKNCQLFQFENKNQALKILKSQKNLGCFLETGINSKRAAGIKKELREFKLKRIKFEAPSAFNFKYFVWGLIGDQHLFICENPSNQFPLGWHEFEEDKATPPNRAYLKLWEVLALGYVELKTQDIAIDVGSCPGGWSWVLSQLTQKVYSIDKAPLDPKIQKIKNITYQSHDAFTLKPSDYSDCTWLFSDIICTPQKLLTLVKEWIKSSNVQNYVCTIKFKGECDFEILNEFKKIENSKIIHLYQNKNEVTWIRQAKP